MKMYRVLSYVVVYMLLLCAGCVHVPHLESRIAEYGFTRVRVMDLTDIHKRMVDTEPRCKTKTWYRKTVTMFDLRGVAREGFVCCEWETNLCSLVTVDPL